MISIEKSGRFDAILYKFKLDDETIALIYEQVNWPSPMPTSYEVAGKTYLCIVEDKFQLINFKDGSKNFYPDFKSCVDIINKDSDTKFPNQPEFKRDLRVMADCWNDKCV